jgi:hypothetical protein
MLFSFVISLGVILFTLVYVYSLFLKERKLQQKQDKAYQSTSEIVEHAHARARSIIDRAVEKSQETMLQTEFLKQELVAHGEQSIQQVVDHIVELLDHDGVKYDQQYQQLFDTIKAEYIKTTNEAVDRIQEEAKKQLESFRASLEEGTAGSEATLGKMVEAEFAAAKHEIEEYKTREMKKIDDSIVSVLEKVIQDVMGRAIPLSEQEKLIIDSLETAKKESVFTSLIQEEPKQPPLTPQTNNEVAG